MKLKAKFMFQVLNMGKLFPMNSNVSKPAETEAEPVKY